MALTQANKVVLQIQLEFGLRATHHHPGILNVFACVVEVNEGLDLRWCDELLRAQPVPKSAVNKEEEREEKKEGRGGSE